MGFRLENVIPVGRRMVEYQGMFDLSDEALKNTKILDCGGGPSSFNSESAKLGASVSSIDPIYEFSAAQIQARVDEIFDPMMVQVLKNKDMFVWGHIKTVDELYDYRKTAIEMFLEDYEQGKREGRYVHEELPNLTYEDKVYDIATCSHLLFLYSEQLSCEFHIDSITEMIRVAKEVRVFPLIDLSGNESPHIGEVTEALREKGYSVKLVKVAYEFLKGADEYMEIKSI